MRSQASNAHRSNRSILRHCSPMYHRLSRFPSVLKRLSQINESTLWAISSLRAPART